MNTRHQDIKRITLLCNKIVDTPDVCRKMLILIRLDKYNRKLHESKIVIKWTVSFFINIVYFIKLSVIKLTF